MSRRPPPDFAPPRAPPTPLRVHFCTSQRRQISLCLGCSRISRFRLIRGYAREADFAPASPLFPPSYKGVFSTRRRSVTRAVVESWLRVIALACCTSAACRLCEPLAVPRRPYRPSNTTRQVPRCASIALARESGRMRRKPRSPSIHAARISACSVPLKASFTCTAAASPPLTY